MLEQCYWHVVGFTSGMACFCDHERLSTSRLRGEPPMTVGICQACASLLCNEVNRSTMRLVNLLFPHSGGLPCDVEVESMLRSLKLGISDTHSQHAHGIVASRHTFCVNPHSHGLSLCCWALFSLEQAMAEPAPPVYVSTRSSQWQGSRAVSRVWLNHVGPARQAG